MWCLCVGDDDADSFESGALRRRDISMATVQSSRLAKVDRLSYDGY